MEQGTGLTEEKWNKVVDRICSHDFPSQNEVLDEAFVLFQYMSGLESGGYEGVHNLLNEEAEEMGVETFENLLIKGLTRIEAIEYRELEKEVGLPLWQLYKELQGGYIGEAVYYEKVEEADSQMKAIDYPLQEKLETYFMELHDTLL